MGMWVWRNKAATSFNVASPNWDGWTNLIQPITPHQSVGASMNVCIIKRIDFIAAQLLLLILLISDFSASPSNYFLPRGKQPGLKLQLNKSPPLAAIWNWSAAQLLPCACFVFISPSPPPPPSRECCCVNQGSQQVLRTPPSSKCASSLRFNWKQFSVQLVLIFGWTDWDWVLCVSSPLYPKK